MRRKMSYRDDLLRDLKDPKAALGYLNVALEDEDRNVFLLALRNVAEAWGGMTKLSRRSKLARVSLYKILSKKGNPEIKSLDEILKAIGFRLAIVEDKQTKLKRAA